MNRKAIIFGIKGYKLSINEKRLFKRSKPWGIILFSRNVKSIDQVKKLVTDIKKTINDKRCPILIDQEGGKVCRLNKIIDLSIFSQDHFGRLFNKKNNNLISYYYEIYINSISEILKDIGININTAPVLDVRRKKSHNVIGTRSFSENFNQVTKLGNLCTKFFKKNKIATVIKHIPGHGLSKVDSHFKKTIIKATKKELIKKDFVPFKRCISPFAMTAHIIYKAYDPNNTATHSKIIIKDVIRKHIKFKGILISDDISMKSLKYNIEENSLRALRAGCNLVLHCNGKIKEMRRLLKVIPKIDKFTQKKTSDFYNFLG